MARSLQDFLRSLDAAGELRRISAEVSAHLEISAIADRVSKLPCPGSSRTAGVFDPGHDGLGGPALLFEHVTGCDFPLAINCFGSYRRMEMALGCETTGGFAAIAARLADLTALEPPASLGSLVTRARQLLPLLRLPPKRVKRGICQEVVKLASRDEVDLTRLPLITCWPLDGDLGAVGWTQAPALAGSLAAEGRYITFAGMHTIHARDAAAARPASHNIGMYRAQLLDRTRLIMHWHMHHDGAAHWRSWKEAGRPMPIAICFGGESVLPYAATAPMPPGMSELLLAGLLDGRGIPLVRARTVPLSVPANSEIVIEGFVNTDCGPPGFDPHEGAPLGPGAAVEGPFGDHTGFYSLPDRYPIMDVTAITHRRNAVFPATIVGDPPQEDYYLGKATERIFLPLLRVLIPDIIDYHLPMFGCFHNCAFIAIGKAYPLHARRVMHAVWGAGQMAWTKFIVIVDEDVNVHDEAAVLRALCAHCDFVHDVERVRGPLDILDHAAPYLGAGHKLGFDATRAIPGERPGPPTTADPARAAGGAESIVERMRSVIGTNGIEDLSAPSWSQGRCVLLAVGKTRPGQGAAAIETVWEVASDGVAELVLAVDAPIDLADEERTLFHVCANCDPGRDLIRRDGRLGLDGTAKMPGDERLGHPVREFPPVMQTSDASLALVERRWREYGLGPARSSSR